MTFLKSLGLSLAQLWKRWLVVGRLIGNFQAQVIFAIFYFVFLLPLGIFFRFFADPLKLRKVNRTNFEKWEHPKETLEQARKQY